MNAYNKIMLNFWLVASVILFLFVTYKSFTDGFNKWGFYYILVGFCLLAYILRKFMLKRMERHLKYLQEKKKENQKN